MFRSGISYRKGPSLSPVVGPLARKVSPLSQLRLDNLRIRHVGPLSLEVAPGECVCLSGPSGAGKSLLLRAIADLEPRDGTVMLDGRACREFSGPEWRCRVGLLGAESQWWFDQVGRHFPEADEAGLAALGFGPEVMAWEVARLSTGERQRLALLRLLANEPQALLLDEPTASLDPEMVRRVEALIDDYRQRHQVPLLWVSHDPAQIARVGDRHLRVVAGRCEVVAA